MVNFSVQDLDADDFLSGKYVDDILDAENRENEHDKKKRSCKSSEEDVNIDEGTMLEDNDDVSGEEERSSLSLSSEEEDAIAIHGKELKELSSFDPDFHRFLKSEEPELLRMDESELQMDEVALTDEDDDEGSGRKEIEDEHPETEQKVLSLKLLKEIQQAALVNKSVKGLKRLMAAFHSICATEGEGEDKKKGGGKREGRPVKFWIPDPDVRDALMRCCVSQSYKAFMWHMFPEEVKNAINSAIGMDGDGSTRSLQARKEAAVASLRLYNAKINKASTFPQYRALKPMIYGFLRALLRLAGNVADRKLLCFIFQSVEHYILFLGLFPGVAKAWLKFFLKTWSDPGNSDIEEGATLQVLSFFRIRDMALRLPPPFLEECLRGAYLSCIRVAKFVSEQSRPALAFMGNGIVELYKIDVTVAYQNAFTYIRQLALVLRQALIKGDSGSMAELFQWQYIQCLRIWVAVVVAMPAQDELGMILFSLAQVIMGVATLANSLFLAPTRFHCVTMLHELAAAGNVYIPTWSLLMDIVDSPKLKKKATPSTSALPQLQNIVKLGDGVLSHQTVQTAVVGRAFALLDEAVCIYSHAVALPELSYVLLPQLRRYVKRTHRPQFWKMAGDIINKMESAALQVKQSRDDEFSGPNKVLQLKNSLPRNKGQRSVIIEKQHVEKKSSSPVKEMAGTIVNSSIEEEEDLPRVQINNVSKKRRKKNSAASAMLQESRLLNRDEDTDVVQDLKSMWSDDEN